MNWSMVKGPVALDSQVYQQALDELAVAEMTLANQGKRRLHHPEVKLDVYRDRVNKMKEIVNALRPHKR